MSYQFKAGDRIILCEHQGNDSGEVVEFDGSIYSNDGGIWVKWDSDGKTLYIDEESIEFEEGLTNDKEQEAVMLLLNLGYTVSKNS